MILFHSSPTSLLSLLEGLVYNLTLLVHQKLVATESQI